MHQKIYVVISCRHKARLMLTAVKSNSIIGHYLNEVMCVCVPLINNMQNNIT